MVQPPPLMSDSAAKQAIDSTRAYQQYLKLRRDLGQFEGSVFWKKVGNYEYLTHKHKGKVHYHGQRSPNTEAEFRHFAERKQTTRERLARLRLTLTTLTRVNKAVRAGQAPSCLIDVLAHLEGSGLAQHHLVLGAAALYAYGQRAGVLVDQVEASDGRPVTQDAQGHLHLLVDAKPKEAAVALAELSKDAKLAPRQIQPLASNDRHLYYLLTFALDKPSGAKAPTASSKRRSHASSSSAPGSAGHTSAQHEAVATAPETSPVAWNRLLRHLADRLDLAPAFEQVVIGRTGKMAFMRAIDPQLFAWICQTVASAAPDDSSDAVMGQAQGELAKYFLANFLISPLQDDSTWSRAFEGAQPDAEEAHARLL